MISDSVPVYDNFRSMRSNFSGFGESRIHDRTNGVLIWYQTIPKKISRKNWMSLAIAGPGKILSNIGPNKRRTQHGPIVKIIRQNNNSRSSIDEMFLRQRKPNGIINKKNPKIEAIVHASSQMPTFVNTHDAIA